MSKMAHVVDGEASESDSEVEIARSPEAELASSKALVVAGEAPESDDESKLEPPEPEPAVETAKPDRAPLSSNSELRRHTLLHEKLWECNESLRAALDELMSHCTDTAVEKLCKSDKSLLGMQESMRATCANFTLALARLKSIKAGLDRAHCHSLMPNVKVSQQ